MPIFNYSVQFWQRIAEEERARNAAYKQGWDYYEGRQPLPLVIKPGQRDDNIILNLYEYIVDKGVAFLFGKEVGFDLEDGADTPAEQFLTDVWDANKKMLLLQGLAMNGAVCGHCYLEIVPLGENKFRLINQDPAYVRPHWDPHDIEKRLWYKIQYQSIGEDGKPLETKRLIEYDAAQDNWLITVSERRGNAPAWTQLSETRWPYPFPPIVDWQNLPAPNQFFGKRDISTVAPQNSINFVASNLQRIIRFHGHPKTWAKGFSAEQGVQIGPDEMIIIPSADGEVHNLEMASELTPTREWFDKLTDWFLRISHVANLDPNEVSTGGLSGFTLKILNWDALDQNDRKRLLYGGAIDEINRRLLVLGGFPEQRTTLRWQSPLPENKSELADELSKEQALGVVSKETMAGDLGRDYTQEEERLQREAVASTSIGSELLRAFTAGNPGGGAQ